MKTEMYPRGGYPPKPEPANLSLEEKQALLKERLEAKRRQRERERRNRWLLHAAELILAFFAGIMLGYSAATTVETAATTSAGSAYAYAPYDYVRAAVVLPATEDTATEVPAPDTAGDLWSVEREPVPILAIDLDPATQWAIYDACDRDPAIFCAVMAIAYKESRFQADAVGDGGRSIGMMQINTRWHKERMTALGVTDLTDPVQCATVAIDYLRELSEDYGLGGPDGHALYMGFNAGPDAAARMLRRGTTSTAYSREALALYAAYMQELAGLEWLE